MSEFEPVGTNNVSFPEFPKIEQRDILAKVSQLGRAARDAYLAKLPNAEQEKLRTVGIWLHTLGYLSYWLGGENGLSEGGLKGVNILEIGGGSYAQGSTYGPNLARILSGLYGADVTLVDPVATESDFLPKEHELVKAIPQTLDAFLSDNALRGNKLFDLELSNAFFGSSEHTISQEFIRQAVVDSKNIASRQLHAVNNLDVDLQQLKLGSLFDDMEDVKIISSGAHVTFIAV